MILLFTTAFILMVIPGPETKMGAQNTTIYLKTNGIHTDIIIPSEYISSEELQQYHLAPSEHFIAYGWGDKGFYIDTPEWSDLKFSTAWKALFMKSPTAMHITKYSVVRKNWVAINVSKKQLNLLMDYVHSGFQTTTKQPEWILIPDASYSQRDYFFEGNGSYSLFCSCNEWVNRGLRKCGRKTALWSPLDWGIFYHLENSGQTN